MIHFLDTSVLVAGLVAAHPHHVRSLALLHAASPERSFCSVHSIAEFYATMTRLPLPARQSPANTAVIFKALLPRLSFVQLTLPDYMQTVDSLVPLSLPGAQIYDALLMACARKVDAETIYTWNLRDFKRVAPDLAARIAEP